MFVEAHEVGTDDWTTLPDANGHTDTGTGDSCAAGWSTSCTRSSAHYQGADCSPDRHHRHVERGHRRVRRLAGVGRRPVGVRRQAGRGLDLVRLRLGDPGPRRVRRRRPGRASNGADGREHLVRDRPRRLDRAPDRRPGRRRTATTGSRSQPAFEEGAVVVTTDTVYIGFGLEGLAPAVRDDFVARSMRHLLGGGTA